MKMTRTEADIIRNWKSGQDGSSPLVSVHLAVYNHEKYLEECMESVLMQETDFPFEILIHDDASTDRSAEIIHAYEAAYPHVIRTIYQPENTYSKHDGSGMRQMNRTLRGKYSACLEGDDCWTDPKKLQRQTDVMERDPELSFCVHRTEIMMEDGSLTGQFLPLEAFPEGRISLQQFLDKAVSSNLFHTSSYFLRTEDLVRFTEDPPAFSKGVNFEDLPLILNGYTRGEVYFLPETMSHYRFMSQGSWSRKTYQNPETMLNHLRQRTRVMERFDAFTDHRFDCHLDQYRGSCLFYSGNLRALWKKEYAAYVASLPLTKRLYIRVGGLLPFVKPWVQKHLMYGRGA